MEAVYIDILPICFQSHGIPPLSMVTGDHILEVFWGSEGNK